MIPLAVFAPKPKPPVRHDMRGCCDERVAALHAHARGVIKRRGKEHADGANDPHVVAVMGDVHRLLPRNAAARPVDRTKANAMASDHRVPLAHVVK